MKKGRMGDNEKFKRWNRELYFSPKFLINILICRLLRLEIKTTQMFTITRRCAVLVARSKVTF